MRSVVVDFETYYDKEYSLSKLTTEAYVRSPEFEPILCGFKVGREPGYWVDGPDIPRELRKLQLNECAVIAHHAHFDGLILNHHYDVQPKLWIDTLSMARAVHGIGGNSLANLAEKYGIGDKGHEVVLALGKRRRDFGTESLAAYGRYCVNDCELEYELARRLGVHFNESELRLIDSCVRMFTEPVFEIQAGVLEEYIQDIRAALVEKLMLAGVQLEDVRSNESFASMLRFFGVDPPTKVSPTTGKDTYAFAKTDEALQELAEHPDEAVQALVAARIGAKSSINETRARRLIDMGARGPACVYLNYYGAGQTGRFSGGDKMNWQNFTRGSPLRTAVHAPPGYVCVVGDSANIESRVLDWLAGQDDQVEAYRRYDAGLGPDIYCVMAESIFGYPVSKKEHPKERQMGKVAKLGLGYGMGHMKFAATVKAQAKTVITLGEASDIVGIYRQGHSEVGKLWRRCGDALQRIAANESGIKVDHRGVIRTTDGGLLLPNGLVIKYPGLEHDSQSEWTYLSGKKRVRIYGGKGCENAVQALARIIVLEQCAMIPYPLRLSVHDEGVWVVPEKDAEQVAAEVEAALRTPLWWCPDLPLNCEVGFHQSYGKAKK